MEYEIPEDLLYTKTHEWARVAGDEVTVGITAYAVEQMEKEVVNVDLPEKGTPVEKGESFGVVDSVKAAFDLYAPVSGEVIDVNDELAENPDLIANSPYEDGWMIKIKMTNSADVDDLLAAGEYRALLEEDKG